MTHGPSAPSCKFVLSNVLELNCLEPPSLERALGIGCRPPKAQHPTRPLRESLRTLARAAQPSLPSDVKPEAQRDERIVAWL